MKTQWVEGRYGFHRRDVGHLSLLVGLSSRRGGGYEATVGQVPISGEWETMKEAKEAAEMRARKLLTVALEQLGDDGRPGK